MQRTHDPFVRREQSRRADDGGSYYPPMTTNRLPLDVAGAEGEFDRVEVRRSSRRKKTISAEIVGRAVVVSIPERMSRADEHEWVTTMVGRMAERQRRDRLNARDSLRYEAARLADLYLNGVRPRDISWTLTERSRWGSCSTRDGSISLSLALADYPSWVRDYVIVHELAHLVVADHSSAFWELVNRYPYTERARGFLIAKGMEADA
jgi:predicted metal-dependent hydrolase